MNCGEDPGFDLCGECYQNHTSRRGVPFVLLPATCQTTGWHHDLIPSLPFILAVVVLRLTSKVSWQMWFIRRLTSSCWLRRQVTPWASA